jgi:nitrate reductase gamma subunit
MLLTLLLTVAVAVFAAGNIVRVVKFARMPKPLRWELYPLPKGPAERQRYGGSYFEDSEWWTKRENGSRRGELMFMAKEVLLLKSVREGFHELWIWAWFLHCGMYLYVGAAVLGIASRLAPAWGIRSLCVGICFLACCLGVMGSSGLIALRLRHSRLRPYSSRASIFNLLLLGAIFVTGIASAVAGKTLADAMGGTMRVSPVLYSHALLVAVFLAYFPFTHMTHAYMKFFTWHGVRWDDAPAFRDPDSGAQLAANLQRPTTWAAPHIAASGASWAEVVASSGVEGGKHA